MTTPASGPNRLAGWRVAWPPILVSLVLSACTVGTKAHWQDSGIYLTAVRELSVLYPHGFCLYQLSCKAWTILFGFLDFTLAVHLFSSLCAALAAGLLARAAERITGDGVASAVVGVLAASGYTWWLSGLYAKGYALYFVLIALLLWRMACRDPLSVLPLAGLAWAAHPSAGLLAPAIAAYLWTQRAELRARGAVRIAASLASALACAIVPSLALFWLASRGSVCDLGHPASAGEWVRYLVGSRFTSTAGVWGFDGVRWLRTALYAWEEFLGGGAALVAVGVWSLIRDRRREAWMILLWSAPVAVIAALFKIEGQYDFWLVVAWMPLWLAAAVGLSAARARFPRAPVVALAGGLLWSGIANGKDLYLRGDDLPETFARCMFQNVEPGSTLVVTSDDALALCRYLQVVRGVRPDVRIILSTMITPREDAQWYVRRVSAAWPEFGTPNFDLLSALATRYTSIPLSQAAIVTARQTGAPPVYFDQEPAAALLGPGSLVPAGFLWKWTEKEGERIDPRAWEYPVTLEQVAARSGRRRGQSVIHGPNDIQVSPMAYEQRFVYFLVQARRVQGDLLQRQATRVGFERSAEAYESILKAAPDFLGDSRIVYPLALSSYMIDRLPRAHELFQRVLETDAGPATRAGALFYLGELSMAARNPGQAQDYFRQAFEIAPPDSPLRGQLQRRLQAR